MLKKIKKKLQFFYLCYIKQELKKYKKADFIESPLEIEFELLNLFNKNDSLIIFDIGACEGEDSIRYANFFPKSTIYSFEPHTDNYAKAKKLIQQYNKSNIIFENVALSDKNGVAEFYLSEGHPTHLKNSEEWNFGNKSSSLLSPSDELKKNFSWLQFNRKTEVTTVRLEDFVSQKKIESIDFAHIDVQGAELMVLAGAGAFLSQIKAIWLEVEAVELYSNQPLKNDVEFFMQKNKFINILDTVNETAGDQLYVNLFFYSEERIRNIKSLKDAEI